MVFHRPEAAAQVHSPSAEESWLDIAVGVGVDVEAVSLVLFPLVNPG